MTAKKQRQEKKQIPSGMPERKAKATAPADLSTSHHTDKSVMLRSR